MYFLVVCQVISFWLILYLRRLIQESNCFACIQISSPHARESRFRNQWNFCLWNLESRALESGNPLSKTTMLCSFSFSSFVIAWISADASIRKLPPNNKISETTKKSVHVFTGVQPGTPQQRAPLTAGPRHHRRTGRGGVRGAAAPPNFGQLRFFGQREKIRAKPVF